MIGNIKTIQTIRAGLAALLLAGIAQRASAAGVTIISHGLNGSIDDWVISMADRITHYPLFPGSTSTCYEIYLALVGNQYVPMWRRLVGDDPTTTLSGEILIKLDWRQLANNNYSTYQIAAAVVPRLLDPLFISELNGHALAELPIHLIGHSRGGSLVCEMSKLLGQQGVWVDHLTTLDPHPLNNDGFFDFPYTVVDAPARTYENVLFHDNYYQTLNVITFGEPVAGAFVRQLTYLGGGYDGITASHSDAHLWYHGTLDLRNPASDTVAQLTTSERNSWYTTAENQGLNAGYFYSRLGRGDRTSANRPAGPGTAQVRDGFNQYWNLGAGTSNNRQHLDSNNGNWPNAILVNAQGTNIVAFGGSLTNEVHWQWEKPAGNSGEMSFFIDDDFNPLNSNSRLLKTVTFGATGTLNVDSGSVSLPINAGNSTVGYHVVYTKITAGGRSRYLYAPEVIDVFPSFDPPALLLSKPNDQAQVTVNGQTGQVVIIDASSDLASWGPIATNRLAANQWILSPPAGQPKQFYRARLRL